MHTRTVFCGLIAGIICAIGLHISFIQVWPSRYISGWSTTPSWFIILGYVFNCLIIVTAGFIASAWGWKESIKDAIKTGIETGLVIAATSYIFSGTTIASILGYEPILKFGLHQTYPEMLTKLIMQAISSTSQWMSHILWLFTLSGIFLGAIGGWLAQISQFKLGKLPNQLPQRFNTNTFTFMLLFTPIVIFATSYLLSILPDLVWKSVYEYKYTSFLPPSIIVDGLIGIQMGVLAFGLGSVWPSFMRWWNARSCSCLILLITPVISVGMLGLIFPVWKIISNFKIMAPLFDSKGLFFLVAVSLFYTLIPIIAGFFLGFWINDKYEGQCSETDIKPSANFWDYCLQTYSTGLSTFLPIWVLVSYGLAIMVAITPSISILNGEARYVTLEGVSSQLVKLATTYAILGLAGICVTGLILAGIFNVTRRIKITYETHQPEI